MSDLPDDPAAMSPDQRRHEIAAILARGILRLRQTAQASPGSSSSRTPEINPKICRNGLDEGASRSLHVFTSPASRQARETATEHMKGVRQP